MAVRKLTPVLRGIDKPSVVARADAIAHQLDVDFLGARSALMTAVLALEGKGVETHIAYSLRMHVLNALNRIETTVTGRKAP